MRIRRSAQHALCVCMVTVVFAGCSGTANVTPSPDAGLAQSAAMLVASPISELSSPPARRNNETIDGLGDQSKVPDCSPSGRGEGYVSVSDSGSATGTYPGTFADGGQFFARCEQSSEATVSGSFSITSGASTISGNFSGPGTGSCSSHPWGETCDFSSNNLTYSAFLIRGGKVRKQFSGDASAKIGTVLSSSHMDLTLKGL